MLLGELKLRNLYQVFRDGSGYRVEGEDGHGQTHGQHISEGAVKSLRSQLFGQLATVEEAADVLQSVAVALNLPFTYGRKLHFYAQSALIVLVVLKDATVQKEGRRYLYRIKAQ